MFLNGADIKDQDEAFSLGKGKGEKRTNVALTIIKLIIYYNINKKCIFREQTLSSSSVL